MSLRKGLTKKTGKTSMENGIKKRKEGSEREWRKEKRGRLRKGERKGRRK